MRRSLSSYRHHWKANFLLETSEKIELGGELAKNNPFCGLPILFFKKRKTTGRRAYHAKDTARAARHSDQKKSTLRLGASRNIHHGSNICDLRFPGLLRVHYPSPLFCTASLSLHFILPDQYISFGCEGPLFDAASGSYSSTNRRGLCCASRGPCHLKA